MMNFADHKAERVPKVPHDPLNWSIVWMELEHRLDGTGALSGWKIIVGCYIMLQTVCRRGLTGQVKFVR